MLAERETGNGVQPISTEVHSQSDSYDGSRTPPDVQYEIMRRHRLGMCIADVCKDIHGKDNHCDPRTAKAVIQNWGTAQHTLRLQAHRSQVVDNLILGMSEAAKRGKLDSILNLSHTLGITEPVKGQHQAQVAVLINLHGGPEPQALVVEAISSDVPTETGGK